MRLRIICVDMHPIKHIRKNVFKVRQAEFAAIAGVTQATVSRWEAAKGGAAPTLDELARIRDEAARRRLRWADKMFFDRPDASKQEVKAA